MTNCEAGPVLHAGALRGPSAPMLRLGFLASNNGSAMRAIVDAIERAELRARPALVISNRRDSPALAFAREKAIANAWIATREEPELADRRLVEALTRARVDLVILSGYLRKLGSETLAAFDGRILNVHPALLPKFGGHGMYGTRVHEAVVASGETQTGATIHLVDGEYDRGRIIAQSRIAIAPGDSAQDVQANVMRAENLLFVDTVRRIAEGELRLPL
jgi:phosphoribosylglycinamide formyltransferase 1